MTVQWPWQRASSEPESTADAWGASSEKPMGWAFAPTFPRMLAAGAPSMLSDSFLATLPTRTDPRSMGQLDHLVSADAPSALIGVAASPSTPTDDRGTQATAATEELLAVLVHRPAFSGDHSPVESLAPSVGAQSEISHEGAAETRASVLSDAAPVLRQQPEPPIAPATPAVHERDTASRISSVSPPTRPRLGIGAPLRSGVSHAATDAPIVQRSASGEVPGSPQAAPTAPTAGSAESVVVAAETDHASHPSFDASDDDHASHSMRFVSNVPSVPAVARPIAPRPVAPERRAPLSSSRALVSSVLGSAPAARGAARSGPAVVQRLADAAVPSTSEPGVTGSPVLDRRPRTGVSHETTGTASSPRTPGSNDDAPRHGTSHPASARVPTPNQATGADGRTLQRAVTGFGTAPTSTRAVAHRDSAPTSRGAGQSFAVAATPAPAPSTPETEPTIQRAASPVTELLGAARSHAAASAPPTTIASAPATLDPVRLPPEVIEHLANRLMAPILRRLKSEMLVDRERRGLRTDLRRGAVL